MSFIPFKTFLIDFKSVGDKDGERCPHGALGVYFKL